MKRLKYLTLAALVAVAACDEGVDPVVAPPVIGTIAGVVTIDAVAAVGVTVTLSSGPTATSDGTGAFQFNDAKTASAKRLYTWVVTKRRNFFSVVFGDLIKGFAFAEVDFLAIEDQLMLYSIAAHLLFFLRIERVGRLVRENILISCR